MNPVLSGDHAWVIAALAASAGVGALAWWKVLKHHVVPRNFGVVEPGRVYRSGRLTPAVLRRMRERFGVRTVVDLGAWPAGSRAEARMRRVAAQAGLVRFTIRGVFGDGRGNPNAYLRVLRILTDESHLPCLVHCGAGAQRTGVAVILFRHVVKGTPIEAALKEAERYGYDPRRNERLRRYVEEFAPAIARAFREGTDVPGHDAAEISVAQPDDWGRVAASA